MVGLKWEKRYGLLGKDIGMAADNGKGNDQGKGQRRREHNEANKNESKRKYAKEATVTVDMGEVNDGKAEDLIKANSRKSWSVYDTCSKAQAKQTI